jgi:hypothetical protein
MFPVFEMFFQDSEYSDAQQSKRLQQMLKISGIKIIGMIRLKGCRNLNQDNSPLV